MDWVFYISPIFGAYLEAKNQRSVIDLLLSREGAMMVASNQYYKLLGKYQLAALSSAGAI